ncbi:MAG: GGDEF domain-containing protein [Thermodesulfobacteriota bacterium]|nr:GGDEF domain-containing protein [Thermodesulfobacteriota bacterium]
MVDDTMTKIIRLCQAIDENALKIYERLSQNAQDEDLTGFWRKFHKDALHHLSRWAKLLSFAEDGGLSQVIEKPDEALEELTTIHIKTVELLDFAGKAKEVDKAFLMAFKLEFYLIHPAIETLFQYLKPFSDRTTPQVNYNAKINTLFDGLHKYNLVTMELELLGETLHRLWKKNLKMAIQSNYDSLTGILNRRGIFNSIIPLSYLAQRNNSNIGIMMIDIDNFKKVNDTYGHRYGDDVLKFVTKTIKSILRISDVLGRYGGEDFFVFLSSVESESIYEVGEKIRSSIEQASDNKAGITISIGMAQGRIHGMKESEVEQELYELINIADEKLYEAKEAGRNNVIM